MLMGAFSQIPLQEQFLKQFDPGTLHIPETQHLLRMIEALIVTPGEKTAKALAQADPTGPDRSCVSRHFSGKWNSEHLLQAGREFWISSWGHPQLAYHIIDDTANPHTPKCRFRPHLRPRGSRAMESLDLHYNHNSGTTQWSHSVVTSHVVVGSNSIPWKQELYRREEECQATGKVFRSKIQIAISMIESFEVAAERVIHLVDSWYMNHDVIAAARRRGEALIGALNSKPHLAGEGPEGESLSVGEKACHLKPEDLDLVTVGGRKFEVWRYEGRLLRHDGMALLIAREKGSTRWYFVASSDASLSSEEILRHYLRRWEIETGYWYAKCQLGFGDYRLRSMEAIQRFWCEVILAYWYLEWLRMRLKLPNLAAAVRVYSTDYKRRLVLHILDLHQTLGTAKQVLQALRIAA